ncbi:hypothetical protein H9Q10_11645 [Eikenella sp. S3360]|uniref:Uncharacterized protein n=1 Tax=Eikenella glucosivorans TaxID=2766967 RepID=A0ABS0NDD2_9NEIS|nr:hypothetical protein [Eikenella glucosivorans]MBH5330316.1 hypothetical protein [Eikenella glucosivorans]
MPLAEIKNHATSLPPLDNTILAAEIRRLKQHGASLLSCIAFVQANRRISLSEAKRLTLSLPAFSTKEKAAFEQACQIMQAEFEQET